MRIIRRVGYACRYPLSLGIGLFSGISLPVHAQQVVADGEVRTIQGENFNTVTDGVAGYAFHATNNGAIVAADANIVTSGYSAYAVAAGGLAEGPGHVELNGGLAATTGAAAVALFSYGTNSRIDANGSVVTTAGNGSHGVEADHGGNVKLRDVAVRTSGLGAVGVYAPSGNVSVHGGSVQTSGSDAWGVKAGAGGNPGNRLILDNVSIRTGTAPDAQRGGGGIGIYSLNNLPGAQTSLQANNISVTTYGSFSNGVELQSRNNLAGASASATLAGVNTLETWGAASYGVWTVGAHATLSASNITIRTHGDEATAVVADDGSHIELEGGRVRTSGASAHGLYAMEQPTVIEANGVNVYAANGHGAVVQGGAGTSISNSTVASGSGSALYGYASGQYTNTAAIINSALKSNLSYAIFARGGRFDVTLDHSVAESAAGVLGVGYLRPDVQQGASAVKLRALNGSTLTGDIYVNSGNRADVSLSGGSSLTGSALQQSGATLNLDIGNSAWVVTGNSILNNLRNAGRIVFGRSSAGAYKTVLVTGSYTGNGAVQMNTRLDAGGSLANQRTDRLLISGDATGKTQLIVRNTDGQGSHTGGEEHLPGEGISLVQVGGHSTAGAFELHGGYVRAFDGSPFQYRLFAYGPGQQGRTQPDPSQSLLPDGQTAQWDYRLQSSYLDPAGEIHPPVDPDPGGGKDGETETRPALVPQGSAYLIAGLAVHNYETMVLDDLQRRLGDIRRRSEDESMDHAEVFARIMGRTGNYHSDKGWRDYGYDFSQHGEALQIGGNWLAHVDGQQTVRLGIASAFGSTAATPYASAAEASRLSFQAYSVALTGSWQHRNGWYADGVLSASYYDGSVNTQQRGDVAGLYGYGLNVSLETGRTWHFRSGWEMTTYAQLLSSAQHLGNTIDKDGVVVDLGNSHAWTGRLGVRVALHSLTPALTPYVRLGVSHTWSDASSVTLSGRSFETGSPGSSFEIGLGVSGQIKPQLTVYGEISRQNRMNRAGFNNTFATLGGRYEF